EHLQVRRPLLSQLLLLGAVIDDSRTRELLRTEAVFRVEVRDREDDGIVGETPRRLEDAAAVLGTHSSVDDEGFPLADDDADVRDEWNAAVRDHVDACTDLLRRDVGNDGR